ncbi:MAG: hypothetical protein ACTSX4_00960, partial [Candidatus Helarchaeota archaeon]
GSRLSRNNHLLGLVLIDLRNGISIKEDYQKGISFINDADGNVATLIQKISAKNWFNLYTGDCLLIVMADMAPIYQEILRINK